MPANNPNTNLTNGLVSPPLTIADKIIPASDYYINTSEAGGTGDPRAFVNIGHRQWKIDWRKLKKSGWLSPKKPARGDKDTILHFKFGTPTKINYISFELLQVPALWSVWYYDTERKRTVRMSGTNGEKLEGRMSGLRINVVSDDSTELNWRKYQFDISKIRTTSIEIRLNRNLSGLEEDETFPFWNLSRTTPYSVGVKNVRMRFKMRHHNDDDEDDDDDTVPHPTGTVRRKLVRFTADKSVDKSVGKYSFWMSYPQGASSSVVPYYLDTRASDGTASVFDSLKLKPLFTGSYMNVYYSDDESTSSWNISHGRREFQKDYVDVTGIDNARWVLDSGLIVDGTNASWVMDNDYMRWDGTKDWIVGLEYEPTFTNSTSDRWLFNFENVGATNTIGLRFNPTSGAASTITGVFEVVEDGTTVKYTSPSTTLSIDTPYGIMVGRLHAPSGGYDAGWYFVCEETTGKGATGTINIRHDVGDWTGFWGEQLRVGTNNAMDAPAQGYIRKLWVRQDRWYDRVAKAFVGNTKAFIQGLGEKNQRTNGWFNGLLVAKLVKYQDAKVGPNDEYYAHKKWTPVPNDFLLLNEWHYLGIITAKFLKLEFSNLTGLAYQTDVDALPVWSFPKWVIDYFFPKVDGQLPYPVTSFTSRFEGVNTNLPIGTQNARNLTGVRQGLNEGDGSGLPPYIVNASRSTFDYVTSPLSFDDVSALAEYSFSSVPMKFPREGYHNYRKSEVPNEGHAYFCGIKELKLYRSDFTVAMDNPEYYDAFDDDVYIETNTGWVRDTGSMVAAGVNDYIETYTMTSFSKFKTLQIAVLDNGWESRMSETQINLITIDHLRDDTGVAFDAITGEATTARIESVTGQYLGIRGGGNVVRITKGAANTTGTYGVRTKAGIFDGTNPITGDYPRTTGAIRMMLPETNDGTYELQLWAVNGGDQKRIVEPIDIPVGVWKEIELGYIADLNDDDWQLVVVQTDPTVDEPFLLDMMGIFQNSVRWQVSNDDGATYTDVLWGISDPDGYVTLPAEDNQLKIKITALRISSIVSAWMVVPMYIESPLVIRTPIDYIPPWGEG